MKIILRMQDKKHVTWTELDEAGKVLAQQDYASLAELPQIPKEALFILLIPGEDVLLTIVEMPKTNRRELIKAVPFALEEQLATDPEQLYFSIGQRSAAGFVTVALMNKSVFEAVLQSLKDHNLSPDIILPDYLSIPWVENHWSVCVEADRVLVRTGEMVGFAVEHDLLPILLESLLNESDAVPTGIRVSDPEGRYPLDNLRSLKGRVHVEFSDQDAPGAGLTEPPNFNLLKKRVRTKNKSSKLKQYWKLAAITCAAWLAVLFGSQLIELVVYKVRAHHLQERMEAVYRPIFPNATDVQEAHADMKRELNQLMRSSRGSHFVDLLGRTAAVLQQYPTIQLAVLSYQDKQLSLQLTTTNLSRLEALTSALNQRGLTVKQNQVNTESKPITAEVIVK